MLEWVREMAPKVRIKGVPLGGEKLIARVETGEIDVAIGSFPALYAGVVEQTLFQEDYVCVVPRTHLPHGLTTLNIFTAARHIVLDGRHLRHIHGAYKILLRTILTPQNY